MGQPIGDFTFSLTDDPFSSPGGTPQSIGMGLHPLLAKGGGKRKFRWTLSISPYIGQEATMLPPSKSARPNISFKEYQVEHLNETIYFPGRVEWSMLEVTVYDIKCDNNPLYNWMKKIYNPSPSFGEYRPALMASVGTGSTPYFKIDAVVTLYSGCGDVYEKWIYMNAYPAKIDWGDLDMSSNEITMADISLRYDRAYLVENYSTFTIETS